MIDTKVANFGTNVNGWLVNEQPGVYGAEYLFRAAVTQFGLEANIAQEALYPATFTDIKGRPLNGTNNYVIHFNPGQTPPVDGFWSISIYNHKRFMMIIGSSCSGSRAKAMASQFLSFYLLQLFLDFIRKS